ncbi:MAG: hypothetical protein K2L71_05345, partial [Muribaculaceae bacterium]|nr:hypothetical protein [Muribaculaceae bacterium]
KPAQLKRDVDVASEAKENRKVDLLDQDNINRFDKKKKKKKKKKPAGTRKESQATDSASGNPAAEKNA